MLSFKSLPTNLVFIPEWAHSAVVNIGSFSMVLYLVALPFFFEEYSFCFEQQRSYFFVLFDPQIKKYFFGKLVTISKFLEFWKML